MLVQWRWLGGDESDWTNFTPEQMKHTVERSFAGLHEAWPKGTVVEIRTVEALAPSHTCGIESPHGPGEHHESGVCDCGPSACEVKVNHD